MLQALFNPRTLLCLLVVVNSGFLFLTDNKLAGLPYLRELYLAGVVGAAVLLLAMWQRPWQSRASMWILFMGVALPVMSALFSWYHFEQPVFYGLLEERRNFLYLAVLSGAVPDAQGAAHPGAARALLPDRRPGVCGGRLSLLLQDRPGKTLRSPSTSTRRTTASTRCVRTASALAAPTSRCAP